MSGYRWIKTNIRGWVVAEIVDGVRLFFPGSDEVFLIQDYPDAEYGPWVELPEYLGEEVDHGWI